MASLSADRLAYVADLIAELEDMAGKAGHQRLAALLAQAGAEARLQLAATG